MFNPAYILPTFLGVCCAGFVIWNVRMTGDIDKLETNLDKALDDNDIFGEKIELYVMKVNERDTLIRGYQQDVDTLREERRIQEQKIDGAVAQNLEYIQKILDLEKQVKSSAGFIKVLESDSSDYIQKIKDQNTTLIEFTGMINTLNNKIPKRDESGKFKKKN